MVGVAGQVPEIDVIEKQSRLLSGCRHPGSQQQQEDRYQEIVTLNLKAEWSSPNMSTFSFTRNTGPHSPAGPPTCCPLRKEPRVLPLSEMPILPSCLINERWLLESCHGWPSAMDKSLLANASGLFLPIRNGNFVMRKGDAGNARIALGVSPSRATTTSGSVVAPFPFRPCSCNIVASASRRRSNRTFSRL